MPRSRTNSIQPSGDAVADTKALGVQGADREGGVQRLTVELWLPARRRRQVDEHRLGALLGALHAQFPAERAGELDREFLVVRVVLEVGLLRELLRVEALLRLRQFLRADVVRLRREGLATVEVAVQEHRAGVVVAAVNDDDVHVRLEVREAVPGAEVVVEVVRADAGVEHLDAALRSLLDHQRLEHVGAGLFVRAEPVHVRVAGQQEAHVRLLLQDVLVLAHAERVDADLPALLGVFLELPAVAGAGRAAREDVRVVDPHLPARDGGEEVRRRLLVQRSAHHRRRTVGRLDDDVRRIRGRFVRALGHRLLQRVGAVDAHDRRRLLHQVRVREPGDEGEDRRGSAGHEQLLGELGLGHGGERWSASGKGGGDQARE